MASPLAADALSLTAGGTALVTSGDGTIAPDVTAGLFVDDRRALSQWRLDAIGGGLRLVSRARRGVGHDRLLFAVSVGRTIDPVALLERVRVVEPRRLVETFTLTAFGDPVALRLQLAAARDDAAIYALDAGTARGPVAGSPGGVTAVLSAAGLADVEIVADGWELADGVLAVLADAAPGAPWTSCVAVEVPGDRYTVAEQSRLETTSQPPALAQLLRRAHEDLAGLTVGVAGGGSFTAAGSPFFLALFGRDSMIAGMQSLLGAPGRLLDSLDQLAAHQGTSADPETRAQPGRILHELRLGRMGVFGVPPGKPYFGAADVNALFAVALGEAASWGADRERLAALLPAAQRALAWCVEYGDRDGDGFIEFAPDPGGLTNIGWKDSDDSMVRADGSVFVGTVALSEVQAYWYRGLRSVAALERLLGVGDGSEHDRRAATLAVAFRQRFVVDIDGRPFVALALDGDKQPLRTRSSNAGHVLWAGILPADIGADVAVQLAESDMASGWGLRTLSAANPGYNPFGYHRGTVWPHDTAIATLGASRYGAGGTVRTLASSLVELAAQLGGELPEVLSGIARSDVDVPVPYLASCRPQAWAAGAPLMAARALLGLEPDVPAGMLRLRPVLGAGDGDGDGDELTLRDLPLGPHRVTLHVRGSELVDAESATGLDIVLSDDCLATTPWSPSA